MVVKPGREPASDQSQAGFRPKPRKPNFSRSLLISRIGDFRKFYGKQNLFTVQVFQFDETYQFRWNFC